MKNRLSPVLPLRLYLIILSLSLLPLSASGQSRGNSYIVNFNKSAYGKGSQTWQIAPYDERWTYFANKNGMVQFDGDAWSLHPLNNGSDVRSVLASTSRKRVYVGGINEFGYYEPDADGTLLYRCMSEAEDGAVRYLGNVWGIHESDNILYFQGDDRVVKYLDGSYTVVEADAKIDCSGMVNGILYAGTDKGVWMLAGNAFMPLRGADVLASKRIRGIVPYKKGVLVATAYSGLYYCDGRTTQQVVTGAEAFMRENEVFSVAKQGDRIALGTIHKGLVLVDCGTMEVTYFNENNGLHNNTVLSVAFDAHGNLWAGLEGGIDYLFLESPFTNLYSHPGSYGTGYTAAMEGGRLYLGTNRGLYYTSCPLSGGSLPEIHPVPLSSGQVWNLCRVGEELFCLHDRGIFLLQGTTLKRVAELTGVWSCQQVMGRPDLMYAGVYNGLYLLGRQEDGEWKVLARIEGINDSCRLFEQESARVIWAGNNNTVTRIELDATLTRVERLSSYGSDKGLPAGHQVYVAKVQGRVCFATRQGIYVYHAQEDAMKPAGELNRLLDGAADCTCLVQYKEKLFCLSPYEITIARLGTYREREAGSVHPLPQSLIEPVAGYESIIPLSDSLMLLPNEGGFALFSLPFSKKQPDSSDALRIKNMYLSYPKDSLVYTANFRGEKQAPRITYSFNSVRFEYQLPLSFMNDDVRFRYRLNKDEWSDFTTTYVKEYSNLPEGEYTFEVEAFFPGGTVSADSVSFSILPPWYRSTLANLCYLLSLLLAVWGIYRWDAVRMRRGKQQAVVEKDKEMQEMEKEYEEEKARQENQIMQLEKEKLEYELKHKSQEMANLMINFLRKNEMLTEIKSEILKVSASLKGESAREGKRQLVLLNNKIDANIQGDEVLKRIEDQFDLVHNNFMKRLHERHPDLSNNERIMCAYLKMNLSTKEIAPLLNISVRGVETVRYRLRKKFGLEREDSLTDYLNNRL